MSGESRGTPPVRSYPDLRLKKAPGLIGKVGSIALRDTTKIGESSADDQPNNSRINTLRFMTDAANSLPIVVLLLNPHKLKILREGLGAIASSFDEDDVPTRVESEAIVAAQEALDASQQKCDKFVADLERLRTFDLLVLTLTQLKANEENLEISTLISLVSTLGNSFSPETFLVGLAIIGSGRIVIEGSAPDLNQTTTSHLNQFKNQYPNAIIPAWFEKVMVQIAGNTLLDHLRDKSDLTAIQLLYALKALGKYRFENGSTAEDFYSILSRQIVAGSLNDSEFSDNLISILVKRAVENDNGANSAEESVPPINWPEHLWENFFRERGLLAEDKAGQVLLMMEQLQITQTLSDSAKAAILSENGRFRITIGRNPDPSVAQTLKLDDGFKNVSRNQALLIHEPGSNSGEPGKYLIRNLSEKVTLVVNGRIMSQNEEITLNNGDLIIIGGDAGVPVLFNGSFFTKGLVTIRADFLSVF